MKESSIDEISGGSEEIRMGLATELRKIFLNQELWKPLERKKTKEETDLAKLADTLTTGIAKSYGLKEPISVSPENAHIVSSEFLDKIAIGEGGKSRGKERLGYFSFMKQAIFVQDSGEDVFVFLRVAIHEMFHFKSYQRLQITTNEKGEELVMDKRIGWGATILKQNKAILADLDEAVVDMLTFKTLGALLENLDAIDAMPTGLKKKLKKHSPKDLFDVFTSAYGTEKFRLEGVIEEIYNKNKDKFNAKEEVFDLFAKSFFSGSISEVVTLIESVFGRGGFKKFAQKGLPKSAIEKDLGLEDLDAML